MLPDVILEPGTTFGGQYRIVRKIGSGGLGAVYEAVDATGRQVALKVMRDVDAQPKERERFQQEAELLAQVHHPHVVDVVGYYPEVDDEPAYIVMDLVPGPSLSSRLTQPWTIAETTRVSLQILAALGAAHALGIVHRDVKPGNVILRTEAPVLHAVVVDFGIATLAGGNARVHTTTGTMLGTIGYAAPEQIRGRDVDARTDLYAVGACMFLLLTLKLPFPAGQMVRQIAGHVAPRASSLRADVPAWLDDIIAVALEHDPAARFQTAEAMAEALRKGEASLPSTLTLTAPVTQPSPPPRAARVRKSVIAVSVFVGGLAVASGVAAIRLREPPRVASSTDAEAAMTSSAPTAIAPAIADASPASPPDAGSRGSTDAAPPVDAAPAPRAPATRAPPPPERPTCSCIAGREVLCETPMPARCECRKDGHSICTQPNDALDPPLCRHAFVVAVPGAACRGRRTYPTGELAAGSTDGVFGNCNSCYSPKDERKKYRGQTSAPCKGYTEARVLTQGVLACDP